MPRLDARCQVDLPVNVVLDTNGNDGITEKEAKFFNVSLGGAYIACNPPYPEKKIVGIRYELPRYGEFEIVGEVVRRDQKGIATRFYNINRDARLKLWDYISENLSDAETCPYCNTIITQKLRKCSTCGWNLNFDSPNYFIEHEKESFLQRVATRCNSLTLEDIYKVLNFIDVEILKIGKSFEINDEFVGSSRGMLDVFSMIRKVAATDLPVLITGESGTGKELTAMAIHERSCRRDKPFVPINCAAIPENLLEAELFGYEKGAFTGASNTKTGKFECANGGTIFLDEISELPIGLQSKLLRFLEDKVVEKIGAKNGEKIDARIIAASCRDIKSCVSKGTFRGDLFYRLDVFSINIPSVRERGDDKVILARYFLNKFSKEMGISKIFSRETIDAIRHYDWPGNVREIISKIRRAVVMSNDTAITPKDLDLHVQNEQRGIMPLREIRYSIEKEKLIEALATYSNNITKVAKALGISRPSVYSLKKKFEV